MTAPEVSVRRPVTVCVTVLTVTVFGVLAAWQLPVDLLPDLAYPTLTIQTVYPDAAPISVEQFLTRPVEEAVGVIPGVRNMHSVSRAGLSEVILEFEWDEPMDVAAMEVREKIGLVELPREAERPRVLRFDPSLDPVVRVAFAGDRGLDELRQIGERWIKPRLEAVDGVAAAKVRGGLDPEIQVEADEDRLATYGLTLEDLARALRAENVNRPGGTVTDLGAVYLVRTVNEFEDLDQVRRTVVREMPTGRVRVEDLAEVRRGHSDRVEITRSGGREAVEIAIHREGSANTVAVAAAVRDELDDLASELPAGLRLEILSDQSRYITDAVRQVWGAAMIGGILAILVLYFFLRDPVPTAIIALTIPLSVIATFFPMQRAGVNLNIMSLGGLALGVGMLVDNAIVVLEAIDRRRREGLSRREAAVVGAGEVAGAVTASTLTTVAVFFPIVFVRGVAGQLLYDLSLTVCLSLLASLVISLTLIPSLAALDWEAAWRGGTGRTLFAVDDPAAAPDSMGRRAWRFVLPPKGSSRGGILRKALLLPFRFVMLVPALLLLAAQWLADRTFPLVGRLRLGPVALPPVGDPRHPTARLMTFLFVLIPVRPLLLVVFAALGALWWAVSRVFLAATWPAARGFEALAGGYRPGLARALRHRWLVLATGFGLFALSLAAVPRLGTELVPDLSQGTFAYRLRLPEGTPLETTSQVIERVEAPLAGDHRFARVFSVVGSLPSAASGQQTVGENLAQIDFVLPEGAGADDEAEAVRRVRGVLEGFPGIDSELVRPSVLSMEAPVAVRVYADDLESLRGAAGIVAATLRGMPEVADVSNTAEPGSPEIRIEVDRDRAGTLQVLPEALSQSLRRQVKGEIVGQFREGEERIDIRVRASERSRERASGIESLRVRLADGTAVPISTVARVRVDRGPAAIHRMDGARAAEITARGAGSSLGRVLDGVRGELSALALPGGAVAELGGQDRELRVSFDSLRLALLLALFLVYVVMAAKFESLIHPFVILLAVPLGVIGAIGALILTGRPISVLALIGAVMLIGIVVNNAIVLVDAINRRRRSGEELHAAITGAGEERFRPIVMTTLTTVLGLLPMALGLGAGDELRAPLAVTVIGGLSAATLLTLIVIPCLYRVLSRRSAGEREPVAIEADGAARAMGSGLPEEAGG